MDTVAFGVTHKDAIAGLFEEYSDLDLRNKNQKMAAFCTLVQMSYEIGYALSSNPPALFVGEWNIKILRDTPSAYMKTPEDTTGKLKLDRHILQPILPAWMQIRWEIENPHDGQTYDHILTMVSYIGMHMTSLMNHMNRRDPMRQPSETKKPNQFVINWHHLYTTPDSPDQLVTNV